MVLGDEGWEVVLRAIDDARLHGVVELVKAHTDAVAAKSIHGIDEQRIAHHADLEAFEVLQALDRTLGIIDVARARVHPTETNEAGLRFAANFGQQLVANCAVDDLFHMRAVAEHKGHIEDVHVIDHGTDGTDRDAGNLQCTDLRLLDHLFFTAELHGRIHLNRQAAVGCRFELFADRLNRCNRRIAERMHVGRLHHHLGLCRGVSDTEARCCCGRSRQLQDISPFQRHGHVKVLLEAASRSNGPGLLPFPARTF